MFLRIEQQYSPLLKLKYSPSPIQLVFSPLALRNEITEVLCGSVWRCVNTVIVSNVQSLEILSSGLNCLVECNFQQRNRVTAGVTCFSF